MTDSGRLYCDMLANQSNNVRCMSPAEEGARCGGKDHQIRDHTRRSSVAIPKQDGGAIRPFPVLPANDPLNKDRTINIIRGAVGDSSLFVAQGTSRSEYMQLDFVWSLRRAFRSEPLNVLQCNRGQREIAQRSPVRPQVVVLGTGSQC
jgi:hypothetical protein